MGSPMQLIRISWLKPVFFHCQRQLFSKGDSFLIFMEALRRDVDGEVRQLTSAKALSSEVDVEVVLLACTEARSPI